MDVATLIPQGCFPSTRYQGSKRKLVPRLLAHLHDLNFDTALDVFGGTGCVAHALKCLGKQVTYNDCLRFNHQIGIALIENDRVRLSEDDVSGVSRRRDDVDYDNFIERTFGGIYFTDDENRWLDVAVGNISAMQCRYKRALYWFALFQGALAKRPYNLFHRKNLYMRTSDVTRTFGNKATWDKPFDAHFRTFAAQANEAVIDSGRDCRALCEDALAVLGTYDLVYIDPPYVNARGVGVDYHHFYHFLEGMTQYGAWPQLLDTSSKHQRLSPSGNPWGKPEHATDCFRDLFCRYRESILVVSYRSDGIPPISDLLDLLRTVKRRVEVCELAQHQYVLSTNRASREVLLVAT